MTWQAQDRCHRIGQTREVHIYRLVSEKTIEENILTKSDQKRQLDHLAIQSGGFNTEFLQKFNPRELLGVQTGGSPPATPPPPLQFFWFSCLAPTSVLHSSVFFDNFVFRPDVASLLSWLSISYCMHWPGCQQNRFGMQQDAQVLVRNVIVPETHFVPSACMQIPI